MCSLQSVQSVRLYLSLNSYEALAVISHFEIYLERLYLLP